MTFFDNIKKGAAAHPVITACVIAGAGWLVARMRGGAANAGEDASGDAASAPLGTTTVIGGGGYMPAYDTPSAAAGSGGTAGSVLPDATASDDSFFQSEIEQAKAAARAAQTASLANFNNQTIKMLLTKVGKGQDATFLYNDLGQVSGLDVTDNAKAAKPLKLLTPLQQTRQDVKLRNVKIHANAAAWAIGAPLPYPELATAKQQTPKAELQAAKKNAKKRNK